MHQLFEQLMTFMRDVWRYRWQAMAVAWVIALTGWATIYHLPDKYTATAQVYVDTSSMLKPLLEGLMVEQDNSIYLRAMVSQLYSRENLDRVARTTGLDRLAGAPQDLQPLLDKLKNDVLIEGKRVGRDEFESLFTISYHNLDPELAKQVVQTFLDIFTESTSGANQQDSDAAKAFLDQQIKEYEIKLTAAEDRVREFKRQHIEVLPAQGQNYFNRLQAAQAVIQDVDLQVREAEQRRHEIQRQLTETSVSQRAVSANGQLILTPVESRLMEQQTRLDDLLLRFTEKHPDVVETRRTIAELEKQRQAELQGLSTSDHSNSTATNPVYQQLKVALGQVESELAGLQVRKAEYQQRVQELQRQVGTLPVVEAELQRLNRDYEINLEKYNTLLSRREAAQIATDVDQTKGYFKIKIIDPPAVSMSPAKLKLQLSTGVLAAGLAGGLGFAFLLAQIRPVVHTRRALEELTGLPVVATISRLWSPRQLLRRRLEVATLGLTMVLLIGAYGVALVLQLGNTALMTDLLRPLGGGG